LTLLPFPPSVFVRWAGDLNGIGVAFAQIELLADQLAKSISDLPMPGNGGLSPIRRVSV